MTTTVPEENKTDDNTVTLTIDGKEIVAEKGELLIAAAQRAGVFIPRFCYHDRLEPVGMCRMCLVEIEGVRGMPPACTTPVAEGMVVKFQQDNVEKAQEGVIEFLLINHPLDCPVCDRGGECPLQDQTLACGPGETRFIEEKRHWEKPIEISDHVLLDRERCIQCSRCTRFADDVAGDPLITFVERGGHTEVNTFPGDPFASYFSGNIVQICPVGALTAKPYRFNSRPWDLTSTETTCTGCSVGCKGVAQTSRNEMVRFLGVDSEPVNQGWLCDRGRYGFDFAESDERIRTPFLHDDKKKTDVTLPAALDAIEEKVSRALSEHGADSVAFLGGVHGTNEDAYAWSYLAKGVIGTRYVDAQVGNSLPADLILTSNRARISDLDNARAIVAVGIDLKESLPLLYLRVRKAVKDKKIPLIDVNSSSTSTRLLATHTVDLVPGNEKNAASDIARVLEEYKDNSGPVIVIAGDVNPAVHRASLSELVSTLLADGNARLLPAVRSANTLGAYEMGLAPGLLPGRVEDTSSVPASWPTSPRGGEFVTSDTRSILEAAKEGEIKVLFLLGANPVSDFPDQQLVREALEACETVIAVDAFVNESSTYADIFVPVTVANEKNGTVTNIEGRVQRVVQVVAPSGVVTDDWKIALMIAQRLGTSAELETVDDITNEIARVAPSFAHLTTGVLTRARDGAIVPIDENKDSLIASTHPLVDTPSWEPIASRAVYDENPSIELEREEHHPSANLHLVESLTQKFDWPSAHTHHLDQYALRIVFVDSFLGSSTKSKNSKALHNVVSEHVDHSVRIHPKDIESLSLGTEQTIRLSNGDDSVSVHVVADKSVMRSTLVAQFSVDHPLRALVRDDDVTDVRVEGVR